MNLIMTLLQSTYTSISIRPHQIYSPFHFQSFSLSCSDFLTPPFSHPGMSLSVCLSDWWNCSHSGLEITLSMSPCGRSSICFYWELRIWALKAPSDACSSKWVLEDKEHCIKMNEKKKTPDLWSGNIAGSMKYIQPNLVKKKKHMYSNYLLWIQSGLTLMNNF